MTKIIEEYGSTAIYMVCSMAVIALIMVGMGMLGKLSILTDASGHGSDNSVLLEATEGSYRKGVSEIQMKKMANQWEVYDLKAFLDYGGEDYKAILLEVMDEDENIVTGRVSDDNELFFDEPGVYRLTLQLTDNRGISSIRKVYVGVREE